MRVGLKYILTGLLLITGSAIADPIPTQYQLKGSLYTGTLAYTNYNSATHTIDTGGGSGFKKEADLFPAEPTDSASFKATFGDVSYLFGLEWIGANMLLSYHETPLVTVTFKVTHIGIRYVENIRYYFFNLENL